MKRIRQRIRRNPQSLKIKKTLELQIDLKMLDILSSMIYSSSLIKYPKPMSSLKTKWPNDSYKNRSYYSLVASEKYKNARMVLENFPDFILQED